jgi:hypothetical protein
MKKMTRFKLSEDNNKILLENIPLFERKGNCWNYISYNNGFITYTLMEEFNDSYLGIFLEDINEQLDNGIDRNNLVINIPKKLNIIKMGDKTIDLDEKD